MIMMSRTYQSSSVGNGRGIAVDPEDRLLWHVPRHRLEGEAVRDAILACAGSLNDEPFGPPVVPPLGAAELTGLFQAKEKWPVTRDTRQHARRSVYLLTPRTFGYPLFAAFDPPEMMTSCPQRQHTVVPTQALALLNSPFAREQAVVFARRLIKECAAKRDSLISRAWLLALGRLPAAAEIDRARLFLAETADPVARTDADRGTIPSEAALRELCLALFNVNEFIFVE
jgi:hypothetical protein